MKIIVIGGTGIIGSAIVKELSSRHEVLIAGRKESSLTCDITSEESLRKMFIRAGIFDAVVIAVGGVHFEPFIQMDSEKYSIGLRSKLMGQVNAVSIGSQFIQDKGSFTLTSGILSSDPIRGGTSASMVNGAIEAFVKAAAIELPRSIRINCVSPTIVEEAKQLYESYFRGFDPVPVRKVALAYSKSIEGHQTGQIYSVLR